MSDSDSRTEKRKKKRPNGKATF
uniref:Uncharacterized protein n=1 Tax=Homo sapiens TaxID=9606 RepID=A0AAQ5BIC9_HUMAN